MPTHKNTLNLANSPNHQSKHTRTSLALSVPTPESSHAFTRLPPLSFLPPFLHFPSSPLPSSLLPSPPILSLLSSSPFAVFFPSPSTPSHDSLPFFLIPSSTPQISYSWHHHQQFEPLLCIVSSPSLPLPLVLRPPSRLDPLIPPLRRTF